MPTMRVIGPMRTAFRSPNMRTACQCRVWWALIARRHWQDAPVCVRRPCVPTQRRRDHIWSRLHSCQCW